MAKRLTQIDKAIQNLEEQIAAQQHAVAILKAQRDGAAAKKPAVAVTAFGETARQFATKVEEGA